MFTSQGSLVQVQYRPPFPAHIEVRRGTGLFCLGFQPAGHLLVHPLTLFERQAKRVAAEMVRLPAPETGGEREPTVPSTSRETGDALANEPDHSNEAPHLGAGIAESRAVVPALGTVVASMRGVQGRPLEPAVRAFMQPRFGADLSRVRVHTDRRAAESAQNVTERAYSVGRDVVFAHGEYQPGTASGRQLTLRGAT